MPNEYKTIKSGFLPKVKDVIWTNSSSTINIAKKDEKSSEKSIHSMEIENMKNSHHKF